MKQILFIKPKIKYGTYWREAYLLFDFFIYLTTIFNFPFIKIFKYEQQQTQINFGIGETNI